MQDHAADQLHIEMALADRALGALAHGGKCRHENVVERLALGDFFLEGRGARAQRIVGKLCQLRLKRIDRTDPGLIAADATVVGRAEEFAGNGANHRSILTFAAAAVRKNVTLLEQLQCDLIRQDRSPGREIGGGPKLVN